MFDAVVSKVANVVRNTIRAIGAALNERPWLAPIVILALFLVR